MRLRFLVLLFFVSGTSQAVPIEIPSASRISGQASARTGSQLGQIELSALARSGSKGADLGGEIGWSGPWFSILRLRVGVGFIPLSVPGVTELNGGTLLTAAGIQICPFRFRGFYSTINLGIGPGWTFGTSPGGTQYTSIFTNHFEAAIEVHLALSTTLELRSLFAHEWGLTQSSQAWTKLGLGLGISLD